MMLQKKGKDKLFREIENFGELRKGDIFRFREEGGGAVLMIALSNPKRGISKVTGKPCWKMKTDFVKDGKNGK
jgi:hypothetical protein